MIQNAALDIRLLIRNPQQQCFLPAAAKIYDHLSEVSFFKPENTRSLSFAESYSLVTAASSVPLTERRSTTTRTCVALRMNH